MRCQPTRTKYLKGYRISQGCYIVCIIKRMFCCLVRGLDDRVMTKRVRHGRSSLRVRVKIVSIFCSFGNVCRLGGALRKMGFALGKCRGQITDRRDIRNCRTG